MLVIKLIRSYYSPHTSSQMIQQHSQQDSNVNPMRLTMDVKEIIRLST